MKSIYLTFSFFVILSLAKAQKALETELFVHKGEAGLVEFNYINNSDSTIMVPTVSTSFNYFIVIFPSGDTFSTKNMIATCTPEYWYLKPREKIIGVHNFNETLEWIDYISHSGKKTKHLIPVSGTYTIKWIVEGQSSKSISIDIKVRN